MPVELPAPAVMVGVQAARYLHIGTDTLRRHVNAGRIPCWTDPDTGRRRYAKAELDRFLTEVSQRKAS